MSVKHDDKLVVKKVNIACLLIALALTILTVFAYITLNDAIEINGVSATTSAEDIVEIIENIEDDPATNVPFLMYFIIVVIMSIFSIVAVVNVIRLIIGWFGFLGNKDSRKMARKLSKHAKIAFGTSAMVMSLHIIGALDNGKFADSFATVAIITGILFAVLFLAVRYYRWFVVERLPITEYLFVLIRDLMVIAVTVILTCMFCGVTPIGDFFSAIGKVASGAVVSDTISLMYVGQMFKAMIEFIVVLGVLGIMRKTVKYLAFDNYRKATAKRIRGGLIATIILVALLAVSAGMPESFLVYEEFNTDVVMASVMNYVGVIVQLLVATIGMYVVASVERDEEKEVTIAAPVARAAAAEAEVAAEATEADVAEAAADDNTEADEAKSE